jgi:hypothetical protein
LETFASGTKNVILGFACTKTITYFYGENYCLKTEIFFEYAFYVYDPQNQHDTEREREVVEICHSIESAENSQS